MSRYPPNPRDGRPPSLGRLKAMATRLLALPFMLVVCLVITSVGVRELFDIGATLLSKWIPSLAGYHETRRLDFAHVMSLGLMIGVWFAAESLWASLYRFLDEPHSAEMAKRWICFGLVACDAILFFIGLKTGSGFFVSEGLAFFSALLATVIYVLLLAFTALKISELESGGSS